MSVSDNLKRLNERIAHAALEAGRDVGDIALLAVSKYFEPTVIEQAYNMGQRLFGESRAQEFRDKHPHLPSDIKWHFIGTLQSNKIKYVAPWVDLIHAVDSVKLAKAISEYNKKNSIHSQILIEINSSAEDSKHGFSQQQACEAVLEIESLEHLSVRGLMTMAARSENEKQIRESFARVRNIAEDLKGHHGLKRCDILSMGMSNDFEYAIKEGSTIIRVGTGIFGSRRR